MADLKSGAVPVPFFDIRYSLSAEEKTGLLARWSDVLDHGGFINGPEVGELESALASFLDVKHAIACSNGSDALVLALKVAGVEVGDEVILPSFTFFATAGAVARIGAVPVFADIDPDTFCLDPATMAAKMSPRTRAILPVHLFGRAADIPALRAVAGDLPLIEDAAQAIGTSTAEGMCGGLGTVAAFSCFPTKNLGACGDAGFLTTPDPDLAAHIRRLREHGGGRQYFHDEVGFNFRHDTLQAAALLERLPRLPDWNAARRESAEHYGQLFAEAGLANGSVTPPAADSGHIYHQYIIRAERRDGLRQHLQRREVGCAVYYPLPLHLQPCFADLGGQEGDLPESERAAVEVLALPIHPGITPEDRVEVVAAIAGFFS